LDSLKEDLNIKEFPEQKDYPEADALVLSEVHDVKIVDDTKQSMNVVSSAEPSFATEEKRVEIIKLYKNIEKRAFVEIQLASGKELVNIHARTIKPDGTIIELKDEDFHTITGAGSDDAFYSDIKDIRFTFPGAEKNCIVEFEYTLKEKYPFIRDEWNIQSRLPKLQNIYRLTVPVFFLKNGDDGKDHGWKFKAFNCTLKDPAVEVQETTYGSYHLNTASITWEQRDISAFEPDPFMAAEENYIKNIKFIPAEWESWSDVSKWYYGHLFKPKLVLSDKVTNKANEIIKNCTSEVEKIMCIYDFVQSIRYIDIELGMGGFIPHTPAEVLDRKKGDCTDKSILLLALLKAVGIEAKPVLVLTKNEGFIHTKFPNWSFNHMIVKASTQEKSDYWMDPSVKFCKLGTLPYQCEGINVLVLNDDETSQIELTPSSTSNDNVKSLFMKIDLTNIDSVYYGIEARYKGEFGIDYKKFLNEKSHDEMLKYCKSLVSDKYLNAEVLNYSISNLDSINSDLILKFNFKVPTILEKQTNLVFLNMDPFPLSHDWEWLGREKRIYDIDFDYQFTLNKSIEIILPENKYLIKSLPANFRSSKQGINYFRDINSIGNNQIVENEKFSITKTKISVQNYNEVKDYFDKVKNKMDERIILTAK
jgi:hypothetical protein